MGEEAALREVEVVGQAADGEAPEAHFAGQAHRVLEDGLAGHVTLAHVPRIARTFVFVQSEQPSWDKVVSCGRTETT
jgi:hypothetical protein